MIVKYVIIIILALMALFMTYRPKIIISKILKREENQADILKIKLIAFVIGIIDFVLALILI